jgi:K+-transporting ATPase KdpF subunit
VPCLRRRSGGYLVFDGLRGVFAARPGLGGRVRGVGTKEMTWAYVLSGAIALGLLVYLVVALFRAEDL